MKHCVITSSSYSKGSRIALHYVDAPSQIISNDMNQISQQCGEDVALSPHWFQLEEPSWQAVERKDPYFSGINIIDTVEEFISLIQLDRGLTGVDVAQYVLATVLCTHLKLQKLVYFCYADYLLKYQQPLFEDKIFAFQFGPVVETVYQKYQKSNKALLESEDSIQSTAKRLPAKSRIMFARDGIQKAYSIQDTLEKYQDYTASQLVNLTHLPNTPWSETERDVPHTQISDETILEFHSI